MRTQELKLLYGEKTADLKLPLSDSVLGDEKRLDAIFNPEKAILSVLGKTPIRKPFPLKVPTAENRLRCHFRFTRPVPIRLFCHRCSAPWKQRV